MTIYRTETPGDHLISERKHKAAKNHKCCSCQNLIEKGDEYTKVVATFDGYFVSDKWHLECRDNRLQFIKEQARKE